MAEEYGTEDPETPGSPQEDAVQGASEPEDDAADPVVPEEGHDEDPQSGQEDDPPAEDDGEDPDTGNSHPQEPPNPRTRTLVFRNAAKGARRVHVVDRSTGREDTYKLPSRSSLTLENVDMAGTLPGGMSCEEKWT